MTNSKMPSRFGVLAMENDRVAWWPGTWKSMYWPGKYLISSGSISRTTRCRMSWVTGSFAIDLDRALPEREPRTGSSPRRS